MWFRSRWIWAKLPAHVFCVREVPADREEGEEEGKATHNPLGDFRLRFHEEQPWAPCFLTHSYPVDSDTCYRRLRGSCSPRLLRLLCTASCFNFHPVLCPGTHSPGCSTNAMRRNWIGTCFQAGGCASPTCPTPILWSGGRDAETATWKMGSSVTAERWR